MENNCNNKTHVTSDDKMKTAILKEIREAKELQPYRAVNGLWICLVKLANLLPRVGEEHEQIASLLRTLSREDSASIMTSEGIDDLLNLDPPLETVLAFPGERLSATKARKELERIRARRTNDPKAALGALLEVVQRIRDKREHGFKTPEGPRDNQILTATALILNCAVEVITQSPSVNEKW